MGSYKVIRQLQLDILLLLFERWLPEVWTSRTAESVTLRTIPTSRRRRLGLRWLLLLTTHRLHLRSERTMKRTANFGAWVCLVFN